jgi:hypothetical protein
MSRHKRYSHVNEDAGGSRVFFRKVLLGAVVVGQPSRIPGSHALEKRIRPTIRAREGSERFRADVSRTCGWRDPSSIPAHDEVIVS